MPDRDFPFPFQCSAPRRFCSLSRTEHAPERPDPISEHYVSLLIRSLSALIYSGF
jgi:hypothetical protein